MRRDIINTCTIYQKYAEIDYLSTDKCLYCALMHAKQNKGHIFFFLFFCSFTYSPLFCLSFFLVLLKFIVSLFFCRLFLQWSCQKKFALLLIGQELNS